MFRSRKKTWASEICRVPSVYPLGPFCLTINLRQWSYHSLRLHNPGCGIFAKDLQELGLIRYTLQFGSCLRLDRLAVISDEG